MIARWTNKPGSVAVEVALVPWPLYADWTVLSRWVDADTDESLPKALDAYLKQQYPAEEPGGFTLTLLIAFTSTGYADPGRISGPPESCYPPEGEDERTVTRVVIEDGGGGGGGGPLVLPESLHEAIFTAFGDDIADVHLDPSQDVDEPSYA